MTEDKYDVLARQLGKTRADVIESLELYGFAERGEWDEYNERLETNDRELHPNGTREQIERVVHEIVGRKTFESPVAGLEWVLQEHRKQAAELLALRANLDEAIEERAKYAGDWLRQRAELSSYNYDRIAWQRNAEKAETERDEAQRKAHDAETVAGGLYVIIQLSDNPIAQKRADELISVPFEDVSGEVSGHEGGLTVLSAKLDTELMDDLDEIGMMLQDFKHTDDYAARHAARSLLSTAVNDYTERAESAASLTPSED